MDKHAILDADQHYLIFRSLETDFWYGDPEDVWGIPEDCEGEALEDADSSEFPEDSQEGPLEAAEEEEIPQDRQEGHLQAAEVEEVPEDRQEGHLEAAEEEKIPQDRQEGQLEAAEVADVRDPPDFSMKCPADGMLKGQRYTLKCKADTKRVNPSTCLNFLNKVRFEVLDETGSAVPLAEAEFPTTRCGQESNSFSYARCVRLNNATDRVTYAVDIVANKKLQGKTLRCRSDCAGNTTAEWSTCKNIAIREPKADLTMTCPDGALRDGRRYHLNCLVDGAKLSARCPEANRVLFEIMDQNGTKPHAVVGFAGFPVCEKMSLSQGNSYARCVLKQSETGKYVYQVNLLAHLATMNGKSLRCRSNCAERTNNASAESTDFGSCSPLQIKPRRVKTKASGKKTGSTHNGAGKEAGVADGEKEGEDESEDDDEEDETEGDDEVDEHGPPDHGEKPKTGAAGGEKDQDETEGDDEKHETEDDNEEDEDDDEEEEDDDEEEEDDDEEDEGETDEGLRHYMTHH
nr:hypothetical protein BaRGS_002960 [Batillaria attramentaria]